MCRSEIACETHLEFLDDSAIDGLYALAPFEGALRALIHAFKYRGKDYAASFLARKWLEHAPGDIKAVDAVVSVPSSWVREWKRGYNPAELLGREIAAGIGRPFYSGVLGRRWWSVSQTQLTRGNRVKNANGSFRMGRWPANRIPKRLLLIDDVLTTGATLNACARIIKNAGVSVVFVGAIAREF